MIGVISETNKDSTQNTHCRHSTGFTKPKQLSIREHVEMLHGHKTLEFQLLTLAFSRNKPSLPKTSWIHRLQVAKKKTHELGNSQNLKQNHQDLLQDQMSYDTL